MSAPEYVVYRRSSGGFGRIVTNDPKRLPPLPPGQGLWVKERTATKIKPGAGPLIAGDADEIIRQVEEKGYYEWPQPKPEDV